MKVQQETDRLRKVLVHAPNSGIDKVTPDMAVELLYEDIVFLPAMLEEHLQFTALLDAYCGSDNVHDTTQLLTTIIEDEKVSLDLLQLVADYHNLPFNRLKGLQELSAQERALALISGHVKNEPQPILPPIPNYIFTRDIGVVINSVLLSMQHFMPARAREAVLSRAIFDNHPLFSDLTVIGLADDSRQLIRHLHQDKHKLAIEGGDVMLIRPDHLLIGLSERTTKEGIESAKRLLFHYKAVDKISVVYMPQERYCMHLDTIFTQIAENDFVAYGPLVNHKGKMPVTTYYSDSLLREKDDSLEDLMQRFYPEARIILCGNGLHPYDKREQWTDGCNLVALNDSVAITYDRNIMTGIALEDAGYSLVSAKELLHSNDKLNQISNLKNTIIQIPSAELSRARGGSHCLTMPLWRG